MSYTPSSNHWSMTGIFKEKVTKDQLKDVLLNSADPIIGGKLYRWKSKHVGAGIYDLWVEEA